MIAASAFMFIILTFDKKSTRIFAVICGFIFIVLLNVPIYDNPTLNRFRTSFQGSEDESYKVRERNRHMIQPYIHTHPIGYGLGTVGGGGSKYAPGHFLAGFPPDSGYLKKALETGWIGLMIVCILYFTILKLGIRGYFQSVSEKDKILYSACTATLFAFYLAEFPQEAIGQITDIMIYFPIIAIMLRLRDFKREKDSKEENLVND
jgi:cell division protein FtsW (lipid II flippase)